LLEKTPVGDGSFSEALKKTSEAKAAFTKDDLIQRGEKLIKASLQHGVLSMRAFVEVDPTVGLICLEAGLILRERFKNHCTIQLCIFAQDPIFYPQDASKQARMSQLLEQACEMSPQDSVLGSTPYVEQDYNGQCRNIDYLFNLADTFDRSVDFHLDYNLDEDTKPLVWYVFEQAHKRQWKKGITIGHATRMSLFSESEWDRLAKLCHGLDVGFVALPHSDLYMQGRVTPYKSRSRATLPLLELQQRDVPCALAVK
jgi:cytosine/adenosine deaminase-related metal-dependent hydrolase